jgi:mannitol-specific phosphotransferase system IIBC component
MAGEYQPATTTTGGQPMKPHRGAAVLVLGIIGILICFICAIIAWVMGASDLKEMDQGIMDPEGRGLTQAGWILGIIGCSLAALGILFAIIWLVFMGTMFSTIIDSVPK